MLADQTLIVLQSIGPDISTGASILYIGLFVGVSLLVSQARSAAAVILWALTGAVLGLAMIGLMPDTLYFLMVVVTMLAIGATVGYNRS